MSALSHQRTYGLAAAAAAILVTVVALRVQHLRGAQSGPSALFTVKTWTRKDCSVTPWTVAERKGFLAEEGIRLEFTGETQPALQIPSILRGDNDVAAAHPNTLAVAKAGGAKITGVQECGIEPTDPAKDPKFRHMWWFVNPKKHPEIRSFADVSRLAGVIKVATITSNTCQDFETKLLADKAGLPRDRIEWLSMPDIQAIQALKQGLIDIAQVHPPFYKGMLDAGSLKIADSSDTGLGAAAGLTYYYFRDEFIRDHPKEVAAFARAMRKAQIWANAHPEESAKLTEEAIGVPVTGNHFYSESDRIDEGLATPWLRDLEDSGTIPRGKVTTSTLVTHQIEQLNRTTPDHSI